MSRLGKIQLSPISNKNLKLIIGAHIHQLLKPTQMPVPNHGGKFHLSSSFILERSTYVTRSSNMIKAR